MKYGDFTTGMRSAISLRQGHTEMITRIKLSWRLCRGSVCWDNGSRIGRLDTICPLKSFSIMKDITSNWITLRWNSLLIKSLLKIIISKSYFLKEHQMLRSESGIRKSLLREFKKALGTLISLEDQLSSSKTTKVN